MADAPKTYQTSDPAVGASAPTKPQTPLSPDPAAGAPSSTEPQLTHLAGLHRMSRTAGLGSSEYTAVNLTAVIAVLVGAASALALMTPVFLFLPVLGVIFAGVAVKQIRSSNGTQTGLPLAVLALVLSIGLTGFTGFRYFQAVALEANDNRELNQLINDFGKAIADKKYTDAYAMTDERFQADVPENLFETRFSELAAAPTYGPLTGIRSNKVFGIDADPVTDQRMALGYALLDTQKQHDADAIRTEVRYRNTDGKWKVYSMPQIFPPTAKPAGGGAGGGAAGPPAPPR